VATEPVYTVRLLAVKNQTGGHSAPCPPGFVWIVRDVAGYYGGELQTTVVCYIASRGFFWQSVGELAANASIQWTGRQLVNPGERVSFEASYLGVPQRVDLQITAYQLSLP
jgi:hypothetical protein